MTKKYSQAQNKATQKYIKNAYDELKIRVPKGEKELFQQMAKEAGKSLNSFIYELLKNELQKEENRKHKIQMSEVKTVLQGIQNDYEGAAIYALVDNHGKKYIGATSNLKRRLLFHENHIKQLLVYGIDGYVCKKMVDAILEGETFHVEVLEMFPDGISQEELNDKECYYLEQAGGLDATYNMKGIKHTKKTERNDSK